MRDKILCMFLLILVINSTVYVVSGIVKQAKHATHETENESKIMKIAGTQGEDGYMIMISDGKPIIHKKIRIMEDTDLLSSWHFQNLPFRIPILVYNNASYPMEDWPIRVHLNFTASNIPKPYNQSFILVDKDNNTVVFQICNNTPVVDYLKNFDLWFFASAEPKSYSVYFFYYSNESMNLSDLLPQPIYTKRYMIGDDNVSYWIDGVMLNVSIHTNNTIADNPLKFITVTTEYLEYEILITEMNQIPTPTIDTPTWATKMGLTRIVDAQTRDVLFDVDLVVKRGVSAYHDQEDSINGPYRLETLAFYFYTRSDDLLGVYAPLLDAAVEKEILMGPVYAKLIFRQAPLYPYYSEGTYDPLLDVYLSLNYTFYSYQRWFNRSIVMINNRSELIKIDDDNGGRSLTHDTYGGYNRFNISPSEYGSGFQVFAWYDDPAFPSGEVLNELNISGESKGNTYGLPREMAYGNRSDVLYSYGIWGPGSTGDTYMVDRIIYFVSPKNSSVDLYPYSKQGSYFVYLNSTYGESWEYDGLFSTFGLQFGRVEIYPNDTIRLDCVIGVDVAKWADIYAISRIVADIMANPPWVNPNTSTVGNIQSNYNEMVVYAVKRVTDPREPPNINATIRVIYNYSWPLTLYWFNYSMNGSVLYTTYYFKPLLPGFYSVYAKSNTTIGDVEKEYTYFLLDLDYVEIKPVMPICDIKVVIRYHPQVSNDTIDAPINVKLTLISSSYMSVAGAHVTQTTFTGIAEFGDMPFGNYTVEANIPPVLGVNISESLHDEYDYDTDLDTIIYADLGKVIVNVKDKNDRNVLGAQVCVKLGQYSTQNYTTGLNGLVEIVGIPLANRSNKLCNVSVLYYSEIFKVYAFNSKMYNQSSLVITNIVVVLGLHDLEIRPKTADGQSLSNWTLRIRAADDTWFTTFVDSTYKTIKMVPNVTFLPSIEFNVSYLCRKWGVVVSESRTISGLVSNDVVYVDLGIVYLAKVNVFGSYMGLQFKMPDIYIVLKLNTTGSSVASFSKSGTLEVYYLPLNHIWEISASARAYNLPILNSTLVNITRDEVNITLFYFVDVVLYAYPEYNESIRLPFFTFNVTVNGTYVGKFSAGKLGFVVIEVFPAPILYGWTSFNITSVGNVRDISIATEYVTVLDWPANIYNIGVPQSLSEITFNVRSKDGDPVGVLLEIIHNESQTTIASVYLENGSGVVDLVPFGEYTIVLKHYTEWGILVIDYVGMNVVDVNETVNYVVSVGIIIMRTLNLLKNLTIGSNIKVLIESRSIYYDFDIILMSENGTYILRDFPTLGAYFIYNGTILKVEKIWAIAQYKLGELVVESTTELNCTGCNYIFLPLGAVNFSFIYQTFGAYRNVVVEDGYISIVPSLGGPPIFDVELRNSSYLMLENVPVGYKLKIYCEYVTPYGLPVYAVVEVVFNDTLQEYDVLLNIADLSIVVVDGRNEILPNATIELMIGTTTIYKQTNESGIVTFYHLPLDVAIKVRGKIGGEIEEISSEYMDVDIPLGGISITIQMPAVYVSLELVDEENMPIHNATILLKTGLATLEKTTNASGIADLGLLEYGEYLLTIYVSYGGSRIPLNYTDAPFLVSSETPEIIRIPTRLGEISVEIAISTKEVVVGENSTVRIYLYDSEGKAVTGADIYAVITNKSEEYGVYKAQEVSPGTYEIIIDTDGLKHGTYTVKLIMDVSGAKESIGEFKLRVHSSVPSLSLGHMDYILLAISVIVFSLVVSITHFIITRKVRMNVEQGVGMLSKIYYCLSGLLIVMVLLAGFLPLMHGLYIFDTGISLLILIACLVLSVMLYGLRIYIDAVKALRLRKISKMRAVMNIWLFILPVIILMFIVGLCNEIEWTQEYVVEVVASLGPIVAPAIVISFLTAYVSVFSVIIVNSYKDIYYVHKKLLIYEKNDVPQSIIDKEVRDQLRRISGSIRIRTLVFLGLLGLSAFTTIPIFQDIAFVIVAIPIALLIIGPYIVQSMIGMFTKE